MSVPRVGIFFVVRKKLFVESTRLGLAETNGDDILIHPGDHASLWEQVIKTRVSLARVSYDYFPRGRVVFNAKERRYKIYVDQCALTDPRMIAKIVSEFHLPKKKIEVRLDPYYKCHTCNSVYALDAIGLDIDDYLP